MNDDAIAAIAAIARFQAAEASVDRLERALTEARRERDEALGALRRFGKQWEQRR